MSKKRILFVDDEEMIHTIIELMFKDEISKGEFDILNAMSVKEAQEILATDRGKGVEIVITDINMPFENGFRLLESLNEQNFSCQKYIVSAYSKEDFKEEISRVPVDGFFEKPIDYNELKNVIRNN